MYEKSRCHRTGQYGDRFAHNLIKNGFHCTGFDLRAERLEMLEALGGQCACSPRQVGERSDAVFIMVMKGQQVLEVMTGNDGLLKSLKPGATIILTATVEPDDARTAARLLRKPVSILSIHR